MSGGLLANQRAFVTGASFGVGAAIARAQTFFTDVTQQSCCAG